MLVLSVLALHVCESTAVAAVGVVRHGRVPEPVRSEVPAREKLFAPPAFDEAVVKHLLRPRRGAAGWCLVMCFTKDVMVAWYTCFGPHVLVSLHALHTATERYR